jgi:nucleoside-diphosphate-sugar epimerase
MKVFVAGATGALGRPVVRRLVAHGHDVVGLTRNPDKRALLASLGARPAVADALDAAVLAAAVRDASPEVVLHLLTALPPDGPLRPAHLKATNAVRTTGTANLVQAARAAGARRLVAESFVGIYGAARFDTPRDEDVALAPEPPGGAFREGLAAMRALEDQLRAAARDGRLETTSLRIGFFYGADVPSTRSLARMLARRRMFVPKGADGIGAFVHIEDAAAAVVAAAESPSVSAVYNVVDDEPMPLTTFFALAAQALGTPPPPTAPAWLVRLLAPVPAVGASIQLRLSNARARRELGWRPAFPTVREGLAEVAAALREAAAA